MYDAVIYVTNCLNTAHVSVVTYCVDSVSQITFYCVLYIVSMSQRTEWKKGLLWSSCLSVYRRCQ